MKEYLKMLKNTFNYSGRARRREYWVPVAINAGIQVFLYGLMFLGATLAGDCLFYKETSSVGFTTTGSTVATILCIPYILFGIYAFITQLSLTVRRFHDVGRPGWLVAICMVGGCCCGIGTIVQFVFCCFDSKEDNEWGENPKKDNEYESSASIIAAASIFAVLFVFAVVAVCTNALSKTSPFLQGRSTEGITAEITTDEDIAEEIDTEKITSEEEEDPNTEDNTEETAAVSEGSVIIHLDEHMQVEMPTPAGLTVDTQEETYASFSGERVNIYVSSAVQSTKEEAIESLKDAYSSYKDMMAPESQETVETTVEGNPVYYSKIILDYEDEKNTLYYMYVDLGAEYLLKIEIDTYQDITDEQALSFAKFEKE